MLQNTGEVILSWDHLIYDIIMNNNEAYKQSVVGCGGGGSMPAEDAAHVTTRKDRTLLSNLAFKKNYPYVGYT